MPREADRPLRRYIGSARPVGFATRQEVTENPATGVVVHTVNPAGFFVESDRGGGAIRTVRASHARHNVIADRQSKWPGKATSLE